MRPGDERTRKGETVTNSKTSGTDAQDPLLGVAHAVDQIDLKTLSYIQLRHLHAALMDAADKVSSETEARSAEDNAGDTVRVPVPPK